MNFLLQHDSACKYSIWNTDWKSLDGIAGSNHVNVGKSSIDSWIRIGDRLSTMWWILGWSYIYHVAHCSTLPIQCWQDEFKHVTVGSKHNFCFWQNFAVSWAQEFSVTQKIGGIRCTQNDSYLYCQHSTRSLAAKVSNQLQNATIFHISAFSFSVAWPPSFVRMSY